MNSNKTREEMIVFIQEAECVIKQVTKTLHWEPSQSQVSLQTKLDYCPINKEHRVPENRMKQHVEKCRLKSQGYSLDSKFLQPMDPELLAHSSVISIDKYKQQEILAQALKKNSHLNISTRLRDPPLTFDRYLYEFTPDERYTLYDYAIQQTSHQNQHQRTLLADPLTLGCDAPDKSSKEKRAPPPSLKELLEAERDTKRRRQAYRKKNTSGPSGRKSDTETLRELIQTQMEFFYEGCQDDTIRASDQPEPQNIKWRYGKRLNVSNYHRQWELLQKERRVAERSRGNGNEEREKYKDRHNSNEREKKKKNKRCGTKSSFKHYKVKINMTI
uniref:U11/U12 small nuclear ribonucleoprotein 48 kDa protein n=2 Tax=Cacopsylla melanoneura TaxID=428564 RepID=A0A8D8TJR1_9HEMI